MFALMTLSDIYRKYLQELRLLYEANEAATITSLAFESLAGLKRSDVVKEPDMLLPAATLEKLHKGLTRLLQHEPVQHVTGEAWFCNLAFKVSADVLVPRPETEELVILAGDFIRHSDFKVLDIGTGSGCIPIALKVKHPKIIVKAIDVSEAALQIARENAMRHACEIQLKKIDFLDESTWASFEKFDTIISNPPYIPVTDKDLLDKNVSQFEPHTALFEPEGQPFIFYKKIAKFGELHLLPGGKIFAEIHEDFGKEILEIFEVQGYRAELKEDIFGRERFVEAERFKGLGFKV